MRFPALAILCLLAASHALARERDVSHGINFYTLEREIALGRQLSAELERQVKLVDDPILAEYVNRVAQNIARQSDVAMPVIVRTIESGDLNAFTLPGGHIYINSGLLSLTESEAELAFVLAHEIGHAAARHATREATRDGLVQLGSLPLSIFGGWTGVALRQLAGPGSKIGLLKGMRDFEAQADRLGVEYLVRAGYDSNAAVDMLERVEGSERKHTGRIKRLSGTHPITALRIEQVQKHVQSSPGTRTEYIVNTSEYEAIRVRAVALEARRISQEQQAPSLRRRPDAR